MIAVYNPIAAARSGKLDADIAALRESVRRLCSAKMRTKAFLHPERVYDDSFLGSLVSPAEWDFSFPYTSSALRYVLNNILNTVIYLFRYIL